MTGFQSKKTVVSTVNCASTMKKSSPCLPFICQLAKCTHLPGLTAGCGQCAVCDTALSPSGSSEARRRTCWKVRCIIRKFSDSSTGIWFLWKRSSNLFFPTTSQGQCCTLWCSQVIPLSDLWVCCFVWLWAYSCFALLLRDYGLR